MEPVPHQNPTRHGPSQDGLAMDGLLPYLPAGHSINVESRQ